MAAATAVDPGGGPTQTANSYAQRLRTNINYDQRLKRNKLEITAEKTEKDSEIILSQESIARVCLQVNRNGYFV